ncbi:DUF2914 domain-containing protein [Fodinibius saliphilus]|uniref:DUF2914 domain-containing protein n=1 Tax=Fodinibius saliphilus TaxID=1920650 RepID=UPI001108DFC8|nr:DUF2914 domain-containing protein [Fodinibius saliphilus]
MNTLKTISIFVVLLGTSISVQAQNLRVPQITIAQDVQDRQPIKKDTAFSANIGSVYCYTLIEGAIDSTKIFHVWHYKEEEKARIPLTVAAKKWRTWSSKSILPSWTGPWRVMIEDSEGNILATKSFTIKN